MFIYSEYKIMRVLYISASEEAECGNSVQKYYKYFNCANFWTRKVFNIFRKLSKTKMHTTDNVAIMIFCLLKSFPK